VNIAALRQYLIDMDELTLPNRCQPYSNLVQCPADFDAIARAAKFTASLSDCRPSPFHRG
jgi:hypothetical protein